MNIIFKYLTLTLVTLSVAAEPKKLDHNGELIMLTDDNFSEVVDKQQFMLVNFCVPWQKVCRESERYFIQAAQILAKQVPVVRLAYVDASESEMLAERYDISTFPTIKWFVITQT